MLYILSPDEKIRKYSKCVMGLASASCPPPPQKKNFGLCFTDHETVLYQCKISLFHLSIYYSIYLPFCQSVYISIYLVYIFLSIYLTICTSIYPKYICFRFTLLPTTNIVFFLSSPTCFYTPPRSHLLAGATR